MSAFVFSVVSCVLRVKMSGKRKLSGAQGRQKRKSQKDEEAKLGGFLSQFLCSHSSPEPTPTQGKLNFVRFVRYEGEGVCAFC